MVEFESAEQAAEAINTLHLSEVGRPQFWVCRCALQDTCSLHSYCGPALDLDEGLWHAGGWQGDLCQVCNVSPASLHYEMLSACQAYSSDPQLSPLGATRTPSSLQIGWRLQRRTQASGSSTLRGCCKVDWLALAQGEPRPLEAAP